LTARFYADLPLRPGASFTLPDHAARHVQVLRLQPGGRITLFNGQAEGGSTEGAFEATIERMGRSDVDVVVGDFHPSACEAARPVHIALGMPANERMDWLVEKATELGVASIQPLMTERSVLRLKGERADKKRAHWQGVAIAACEQCGRNRLPLIHAPMDLADWLRQPGAGGAARWLLSLRSGSAGLAAAAAAAGDGTTPVTFLAGPEGGLGAAEEEAALAAGFQPVTLGSRVLRSETAPLAALAWLTAATH
jgi:16S rRNA (uracil1498-N3)-methyltransferase